jgi:hypothetical protein
VYTSTDGRSWDNGTEVTDRSVEIDASPAETIFVRITATNAGGESFPSEVVGARRMPGTTPPPILLVAAFDRLDANQLVWEDVPVLGELRRMTEETRLNPRDVVARQGRAIATAGWYFDAISDELLESVDLDNYSAVVWIAGEESTFDESISESQQVILRDHWSQGGALWVSGSEVLWDLDYLGSDADKAFSTEVLGASLSADDAGTEGASGTDILTGIEMDFSEAGGAPYPNEYPDVLASDRTVIAEYAPGQTAAVLGERVAHFGFPVECIGDETVRVEVAARVLDALLPDWEAPETGTPEGDDTGGDADSGNSEPSDPAIPDQTKRSGPGDESELSKLGGCACQSEAMAPASAAWICVLVVSAWRRRDAA